MLLFVTNIINSFFFFFFSHFLDKVLGIDAHSEVSCTNAAAKRIDCKFSLPTSERRTGEATGVRCAAARDFSLPSLFSSPARPRILHQSPPARRSLVGREKRGYFAVYEESPKNMCTHKGFNIFYNL